MIYLTRQTLASYIDHAVLQPQATPDQLQAACELCAENNVKSICVRPCDVSLTKDMLTETDVLLGTVVGFPTGSTHPKIKIGETRQAIEDGADEIDMVLNIGWLKYGQLDVVEEEIRQVVQAADSRCVKVILECCYLTDEEKVNACKAIVNAGAPFVKTSTGFGSSGATIEDVKLLRETVGKEFGVKASGGIASLADAQAIIQAGATSLGTSKTEAILNEMT